METSFLPSTSQLPIYLALARGYYRAHGLNVKVTSGKGSVLTAQQVAAGQYDIGLADLTSVAELRAKGAPVEAFMAETDRTTFGLTASKADGIKTWRDLYGKRVLVAHGAAPQFLLPATFMKLGLDVHRVTVVNVPASSLDPEYIAGKAAAAAGDVAGAFVRENAGRPSRPLWFAHVLNVVGYGLFARKAYIDAHPNVVSAFAAATAEALNALAGSPKVAREAARDMIARNKARGQNVQSFSAGWPLYQQFIQKHSGRPLGWQSPATWSSTLKILRQYAGLKGDTNPTDYYTNRYLGGGSPGPAGGQ